MPLVFNPFDPFAWTRAWRESVATASLATARVPRGKPVDVEVRQTDHGVRIAARQLPGKTELTFSGHAQGPAPDTVYEGMLGGRYVRSGARTVFLGVAIDEAPTEDVFGRTNFTEKNQRTFVMYTETGESGRDLAERCAREINRKLSAFRADVSRGATPDAGTLVITRV